MKSKYPKFSTCNAGSNAGFFICLITIVFHACNISPQQAVTTIKFSEDTFYFGSISRNKTTNILYHYTNTGTSPLILKKVNMSCGCTHAQYDTLPLAPGGTGVLTIVYDPSRDSGRIIKSIVVQSNTEPQLTPLYFWGEVK
jgi:Protein of unknown function (DUF1573)